MYSTDVYCVNSTDVDCLCTALILYTVRTVLILFYVYCTYSTDIIYCIPTDIFCFILYIQD